MKDEVVLNDASTTDEPDQLKKWVQVLVVEPTAGTSLTKTERKVFNVLLRLAVEQGGPGADGFFRATLKDIGSRLGMTTQPNSDFYKQICLGLMTPVTFSSPTEGEGERWKARPLVAKVDIDSKKDAGGVLRPTTIYWRFDSDLEPMLLAPERYALLRLDSIAKLGSHAEVALYEICARYQGTGSTGWHPWQWWIPILTGHSTDGRKSTAKTYDEFKYFNARILKPAVEGVNTETEITVTVDVKRAGRSVTDLRFLVSKKSTKMVDEVPTVPSIKMDLIARAGRSGIKPGQVEALMKKYSDSIVEISLGALEDQIAAREKPDNILEPIKSPLAYLRGVAAQLANDSQGEMFSEPGESSGQQERRAIEQEVANKPDAPAERRNAWKAKLRAELASLPDDEYLVWVEKAFEQARQKGNVTAQAALKMPEALKRRTLTLAEVIKVYGPSKYGKDWEEIRIADGLVEQALTS